MSSKRKVIDIYPPHAIPKEKQPQDVPTQKQPQDVLIHVTRFRAEQKEYYPGTRDQKEEEKVVTPVKAKRVQTRSKKLIRLGLTAVAVGIFYYLAFFAFVQADVSVVTKKMSLPFSGIILADRNINEIKYSQGVIPANLFVFEESVEDNFISTGKGKDENKAQGVITIYNNYSTSPQILVATTRFETPDHKIFRLDSRIVVPAASKSNGELIPSSIDAKVTADQAGPDYNIEACQLPDCHFTIPGFEGSSKFKGFYGVSKNSMEGGSVSAIPMVTSDDSKKAETAVIDKLMKVITEDIENKVPAGLTVVEGARSSINITKVSSDVSVGDIRETFTVKGEGEVKILAFKDSDLNDYIQNKLEGEKEENYEYYGSPQIEFQEVKPDFSKGTMKLVFQAQQPLRYHLDPDIIQDKLLGQKASMLDSIFQSLPGVETVNIKMRPFWVKKIPSSSSRVNLSID